MAAIPQVINVAGTVVTADWGNQPASRTSVLDTTNPQFPRTVRLSDNGVTVSRGSVGVGIPIIELFRLAEQAVPTLTWPPVIATQPSNGTVTAPAPASFNVVATSEVIVTTFYQWYTVAGGNLNPVPGGGVYSGTNGPILSISDSTGLNGIYYECVISNIGGTVATVPAYLSVS